jgi:hypothetical protein
VEGEGHLICTNLAGGVWGLPLEWMHFGDGHKLRTQQPPVLFNIQCPRCKGDALRQPYVEGHIVPITDYPVILRR